MAIYRPPKARWPLAVATFVGGLLLGLLIAVLLRSDPDPAAVAGDVTTELAAAAGSLEVVLIEYEESVVDGEVQQDAEYRGALDALGSSRDRYESVSDAVAALAPDRADEIEGTYDEAESQMEDLVDATELESTLSALEDLLRGDSSS